MPRSAGALVVAMAACGRIDFEPSATSDATPDAGSRIDVLVVPGDGTPVVSTQILATGVTYQLRVSGTFIIGGGIDPTADAEFWDFASGPHDLCDDQLTDAGLSIDDPAVDGEKLPKWGSYRADHIYVVDFVGTGASITAKIHDVNPGNNTGALSLEIFGP